MWRHAYAKRKAVPNSHYRIRPLSLIATVNATINATVSLFKSPMLLRSAVFVTFLLAGITSDAVAQDQEKALEEQVCEDGARPISVFNTGKVFCAKGPLCSGASSEGRCPEPQSDLSFGSYCGRLQSRAFGCIPLSLPPAVKMEAGQHEDLLALKPDCSILPHLAEVPVQGIGKLCAQIPICSGNVTGNCPVTLTDLNATYRCVSMGNDTFGCVG